MREEKHYFGELRSLLAQPWTPELAHQVASLLDSSTATRSMISYLSSCLVAWMEEVPLGRFYLSDTPYAHPIFSYLVQWKDIQVFLNPWCRAFERTSWETYLRAEAYQERGRGVDRAFASFFDAVDSSGDIAASRVAMSSSLFNDLRKRVTPIAPMDEEEYRAYMDTKKVEESERIYGCQMQFSKDSLPFFYISTARSFPSLFNWQATVSLGVCYGDPRALDAIHA